MKACPVLKLFLIIIFQYSLPVLATPVFINEVLFDGPGPDADDVFTELYGVPGSNLDGWSLTGVNGATGEIYRSIDLSGFFLPETGFLLLTTTSANPDLIALANLTANVDWQNGPDSIQLRDPDGYIIDALQYGDAGINNHGEGRPALIPVAGQSLSRKLPGLDSNDNLSDFLISDIPSPGTGGTVVSVDEPGILLLLVIGLVLLIPFCWRQDRYLTRLVGAGA